MECLLRRGSTRRRAAQSEHNPCKPKLVATQRCPPRVVPQLASMARCDWAARTTDGRYVMPAKHLNARRRPRLRRIMRVNVRNAYFGTAARTVPFPRIQSWNAHLPQHGILPTTDCDGTKNKTTRKGWMLRRETAQGKRGARNAHVGKGTRVSPLVAGCKLSSPVCLCLFSTGEMWWCTSVFDG